MANSQPAYLVAAHVIKAWMARLKFTKKFTTTGMYDLCEATCLKSSQTISISDAHILGILHKASTIVLSNVCKWRLQAKPGIWHDTQQ